MTHPHTTDLEHSKKLADACKKMQVEEWRPIDGYEGLYEVSNTGRVKSLKRDRVTKSLVKKLTKGKYLTIKLSKSGVTKVTTYYILTLLESGKVQ